MNNLIKILFLLVSIQTFSQVGMHNTSITIKDNSFMVFGNVSGNGEIKVLRANFKAYTVGCSVEVVNIQSITKYFQSCINDNSIYYLYDLTGKYLNQTGLLKNLFKDIKHPKLYNTPLIVYVNGRYYKRIFKRK